MTVIATTYAGVLVSLLVVPDYEEPTNSIEQLLDEGGKAWFTLKDSDLVNQLQVELCCEISIYGVHRLKFLFNYVV